MILVCGLLCALPAGAIWVWKNDFGAGVLAWFVCMAEMWIWFFWVTAGPLSMVIGMQGFVLFVAWWTWKCFYSTKQQRKPVQQIILLQSGSSNVLTNVRATWLNQISPWLALLTVVGVGLFLAVAWLNGVSSPYRSPEDLQRSNDAMKRNQVSSTDPAEAFRQTQSTAQPPQSAPSTSWSNTDDLSDWGKYVR